MNDNMENQPTTLEEFFPKSLDNIIRTGRDRASIGLATSEEIAVITSPIYTDHAKASIDDWRLIAIRLTESDIVPIFLLGNNGRLNWMTSCLVSVDLSVGFVETKSGSIYRLVGEPGEGEPGLDHLLHVCAVLHDWGLGDRWGVPHIFY